MRYLTPDSSDSTGSDSGQRPLDAIPTGMETDPHADQEVISKNNSEAYPKPVQAGDESAKIAPDDLSDSIAYALDGSGPGPTNAPGHKVITEGITGASLGEEEENLRG